MAFANKIGSLLKRAVTSNTASPSVLQAIRSMSSSKLFVGGVSYNTDDMSLKAAFSCHGEVIEARIIMDRETGRSRGFGFVTFTSTEEASSALAAMDGKDLHGRIVRVNYANDRPRGGGFVGGAYGGGYGGGGYGGGGGYDGGSGGGSYGGNSYNSGGGSYGDGAGGAPGGYGGGGSGGGGYGGNSHNSGGGDYDDGAGGAPAGSYGDSAGGAPAGSYASGSGDGGYGNQSNADSYGNSAQDFQLDDSFKDDQLANRRG